MSRSSYVRSSTPVSKAEKEFMRLMREEMAKRERKNRGDVTMFPARGNLKTENGKFFSSGKKLRLNPPILLNTDTGNDFQKKDVLHKIKNIRHEIEARQDQKLRKMTQTLAIEKNKVVVLSRQLARVTSDLKKMTEHQQQKLLMQQRLILIQSDIVVELLEVAQRKDFTFDQTLFITRKFFQEFATISRKLVSIPPIDLKKNVLVGQIEMLRKKIVELIRLQRFNQKHDTSTAPVRKRVIEIGLEIPQPKVKKKNQRIVKKNQSPLESKRIGEAIMAANEAETMPDQDTNNNVLHSLYGCSGVVETLGDAGGVDLKKLVENDGSKKKRKRKNKKKKKRKKLSEDRLFCTSAGQKLKVFKTRTNRAKAASFSSRRRKFHKSSSNVRIRMNRRGRRRKKKTLWSSSRGKVGGNNVVSRSAGDKRHHLVYVDDEGKIFNRYSIY